EARELPPRFTEDVLINQPSFNVMNKLQQSILSLYTYDKNPDNCTLPNIMRQSLELIARFPTIITRAYQVKKYYYDKVSMSLHYQKPGLSTAESFLYAMRPDHQFTHLEAKILDLALVLHAEHGGGNNSAFACRVLTSTGTDTYGAISAAVNSLKGPLHGGANSKVMEMFNGIYDNIHDYNDDDEIVAYLEKLLDGTAGDGSKKIYGLGHAVYTESDPRAQILKKYARSMAEEKGIGEEFRLMESVERLGVPLIIKQKNFKVPICANVDMYSGLVYSMLGIPEDLFTPLFAIARISGWCAHRVEELLTCNKIIRPAYRAAFTEKAYVPMSERK
ncbi:MAG: citrate synthase, partial [Oscillospiraceae bacterium]